MSTTARTDRPLGRILPLLEIRRSRLLAAIAAAVTTLGSALALAAVSAWLVTTAWTMPPVLDLTVAVVAVRALGISRGVFRWVDRMLSHDVALRGVVSLRSNLFRRLASRDADSLSRLRRGDLLTRLGDDAQEMADHVILAVVPAAAAVVMALAAVLVIAPHSLLAAAAMLLALLMASVLAPWAAHRAAVITQDAVVDSRSRVTASALELLDDATALHVGGLWEGRRETMRREQREHDADIDRAAWPSALASAAVPLSMIPALLGALLAAGSLWAADAISAGAVGILVLLPLSSFEAASTLPAAAAQRARSVAAAQRLADLLGDAGSEDAADPETPRDEAPVPHLRAAGLQASWTAQGTGVRGLDLDLPPGSRLAIIGPSGSGKSNLLLALAGLLDAGAGTVHVRDDRGTRRPDPTQVVLFAEDAHVFATTVRENLRVARGDATDEQIREALQSAGLIDWTPTSQPLLETTLGPDGTTISGGERRRLLLARALLRRAPITLLDEPTEHLDADRGDALLRGLLDPAPKSGEPLLPRGHTVVVVTHRPQALPEGTAVLALRADGGWSMGAADGFSPAGRTSP